VGNEPNVMPRKDLDHRSQSTVGTLDLIALVTSVRVLVDYLEVFIPEHPESKDFQNIRLALNNTSTSADPFCQFDTLEYDGEN